MRVSQNSEILTDRPGHTQINKKLWEIIAPHKQEPKECRYWYWNETLKTSAVREKAQKLKTTPQKWDPAKPIGWSPGGKQKQVQRINNKAPTELEWREWILGFVQSQRNKIPKQVN